MEAIVAATILGIVMMFTGLFVSNKTTVTYIATALFALLLGVNIHEYLTVPEDKPLMLFNDMLRVEHFSLGFNTLMTACTLLYLMLIGKEFKKVGSHVAEYFALIFFIMVGIYLMSEYNTLLMLFIGIEIMSIPQYILAGSDRRNLKSSEASLKYFLMGSFSTGILLMGITLIYGATRTFNIMEMVTWLNNDALDPLALAGIIFLIVAIGFKVSAAPVHTWTPDVYDGTPTAFTGFMATVVKAAGFFAFLRLFHIAFGNLSSHWSMVIAIITAATLLVGNVTAVYQQSVKRMLAYSSIAQAGFMLFAILAVHTDIAWKGILIYSVSYSIATIGIFGVLIKLKDYTYDGFNGLAKKEPLLAFATTIFIFSLAGIPLTAGFISKYYMLLAVVKEGNLLWLVIFALCMAAISIYYYFKVLVAMYFKEGDPELAPVTAGDKFMLLVMCLLVILIGIAPQVILGCL